MPSEYFAAARNKGRCRYHTADSSIRKAQASFPNIPPTLCLNMTRRNMQESLPRLLLQSLSDEPIHEG
jgi:hypothetical protein